MSSLLYLCHHNSGQLTVIGLSYEAEDVSSTGTFCPSFCYGYLGYGRRKRNAAVCPSYCYAVNMGRKRRGIPGGSNQASVHSLPNTLQSGRHKEMSSILADQ